MQTVSTNLQTELDKGQTDPRVLLDLYEVYDHDYTPGVSGFDPADAVETFAAQEITWNLISYRREVMSRGNITKSITEKTNTVTINFSNVSRYLTTWAQSTQVEGKLLVIRCVCPSVTDDSLVLFVGRCDKPSDIDKTGFSLSARQDFGNINVTVPPRKFTAEDPEGRLPSDPLYEGINLVAINGSFTFPQVVPSTSFFGRSLGRRKTVPVTQQWSSMDSTPYGQVVPEVFGRAQMQAIMIAWADKGSHVGFLGAFANGPISSITNLKTRTEGLSDPVCSFANPPAAAVIHLGDAGGTGTNTGNTCQADLGSGQVFSHLAYVEGAFTGWVNGQIVPLGLDVADEVGVLTGIIRGRKITTPDASGDFNQTAWSDNPAYIARFILTDPAWCNIDPAFIDDDVLWETGKYCDFPLIDDTNTQVIVIPGPDVNLAGTHFTRFKASGLYTPRHFLYYHLGDTSIVPETVDGPYIPIDTSDPVPDPSDPSDPAYISQKPLIKRYRANFPVTEEVRAVDLLYKILFPAFKGYMRVSKQGKYQVLSEKPSDATRLRTATAVADTSIPVLNVTPWKSGPELLKGRVLLGFGLTTSEVRTVSAAAYSSSGNSVTLSSSGSGITATASGANLSGGSSSVQATGTVTISGTPNAGDSVTATIDGIAVSYTLIDEDTTGTTAAMLAHYINANQRLNKYILASWDSSSPTVVTLTCLHGVLTVPALLKAHATGIADPTSAPTCAGASGGSLPAGTYLVAYADTNALGSTALTATASVTVTANQKINVSSLPALVGTGRDFYMSEKAGSTNLRYVTSRTDASNFSILDVPENGAARPSSHNTTAEELLRVAMSFATNSQDLFPVWKPSFTVVLDDVYLPATPNGHKYLVTGGGITGTTEPTWPTGAGGAVASGTATFTEIGSTVLQQAGLTRANVLKDSFKWPLGSRQGSVNQIKGNFRDSKQDFALTPYTVNDRTHQGLVKKIYPLEIDLSAVDNENQMARLGNGALAKNREGDHFHAFGARPAALVLEEGDVICASDDSGGLVNIVTRIEELSIKPNHEVDIVQSRLYSTLMFSDDVGAQRIPIASTLRFAATKNSTIDFIDTPAIRDSDALVPGFKVSISHDLDLQGDWRGWTLWADFGDGYQQIAEGDVPATVGTATTTLSAVSDIDVLDELGTLTVQFDFTDDSLADSTEADLIADPYRNLLLYGDEYIQFASVTANGGRSYTFTDLLRGRFETDDTELTHSASERVVYINGAEVFVPVPVEHVNQEFNYKAVTTNQDVVDATPVPFTWRGNNVRPRKISNVVLMKDGANDWLIQFIGHPRPIEEPATYNVEIWEDHTRNDPTKLKRTLPVTDGTTHACLLNSSGSTVFDPNGDHSYLEDTHTNKNNLTGSGGSNVGGQTLEDIRNPWTRYDFTLALSGIVSGFQVGAGLHHDSEFSTTGRTLSFSIAPVAVQLFHDGVDGHEIVTSYGTMVSTDDIADSGDVSQRYTILLSGSEYRVYRDYRPSGGQVPVAIIPAPSSGFPFPLRLHMVIPLSTGPDGAIENVMAGGALRPTTIYSAAQQIEDFGVEQSVLFLRIYQLARYEGIGIDPVDV